MLQKCSILRVLGVFFNEPTKLHYLIEISKKASLAHTSTKKHLDTLQKLSIIKEEIEIKGQRKFPVYQANTQHKNYQDYKKIFDVIKQKEPTLGKI